MSASATHGGQKIADGKRTTIEEAKTYGVFGLQGGNQGGPIYTRSLFCMVLAALV